MTTVHALWVVSAAASLGLLVAGLPAAAGLLCGSMAVVDLLMAAFTGKQTNDGTR